MSVSFSKVIKKQIELYVAKTAAENAETIHVVSFKGKDKLFSIFSKEIKKRTKRISDITAIGDSTYNIDGKTIISKNYTDIKRILNNIERTKAFKTEAGEDYDLERYTVHDVLLNMQKNVPLSLIKKLKSSTSLAFVKYSAVSDTYVGPRVARSNLILKVIDSSINTDNLTKFFNDYVYTGGNVLIARMSKTVEDLFLTGKAKTYKKKNKTTGKVKRKVSSMNVIPHNPIKLKDIKGKFTSTIQMMNLLKPLVMQYVKQNMDTASYFKTLTGRFTKTVSIDNITQMSNKLLIQYDYMTEYNSFRTGMRLHRPGREPETVIDSSIRLAAAKVISKKFKIITQRKSYI